MDSKNSHETALDKNEEGIPKNLRPAEAARYLAISEPTLARWRQAHNQHLGPAFIRSRTGGCVIYRRNDLDAWLEENRVPQNSKQEGR